MTIWQRIIETKRQEVRASQSQLPINELKSAAADAPPPLDFLHAVLPEGGTGIRLIAEIKKASPSAGLIVADFDPVRIARAYHTHGASALSVLTDAAYFLGALEHLALVKADVPLPVLRKDFLIDEYQVYESRVAGADAILLIVEAIGASRAAEWTALAHELKMAALVEVHSAEHLRAVLEGMGSPSSGRYLLGINNRDLTVQRTDLKAMRRLSELLPPHARFVAESGIATRADVEEALSCGAGAILVGEAILKSPDMGGKINELLGRSRGAAPTGRRNT